jgi:hypothetical protein
MTTIITQYDDVDLSLIPADAEAVAAYVGGSWPDYSKAVADFPKARHKSIAVNVDEDADILDIESGDAVPADAPVWYKRQKARGLALPGFYSDASEMPSVVAELDAAGIEASEYVLWVAHLSDAAPAYPFEQNAKAVQWTFTALGRNLDQSACVEEFWSAEKPPAIVNPEHYDWFIDVPFKLHGAEFTELAEVKRYDKLRALDKPTADDNAELTLTRTHLLWLAERVLHVANEEAKDGKRSWQPFHRGWRYQQMIHRAGNWRFV